MPSVAGDIELMPVTDIVAWLANRRPTATLTVKRRDVESRFMIRDGVCTQASSTDPREYLGQHLINFGYIDEDGLQRAFDTQKETKVPLGRVLVMVEALTQEQLQRVLTFKTREGLLEALCWNDGHWKLTPGVDADRDLDSQRPVDLREVSSEAAARRQMWNEIRRVFPSDATRCDVLEGAASIASAFDRRLLTLMGSGKTVGEAALELRAMDFQTYARLYDLANRKLLRARVTTMEISIDDLAQLDILHGFAVAAGPVGTTAAGVDGARPFQLAPPAAVAGTPATPTSLAAPTPTLPVQVGEITGNHDLTPGSSLSTPPPTLDPLGPAPATAAALATAAVETALPPLLPLPALPPAPPARSQTSSATSATSAAASSGFVRLRPEQAVENPGVHVPAEAQDPLQAMRVALAGRSWADVVTLAQRLLEHDPSHGEAIAALRVADGQLRRGRETTGDIDLTRAPRLAQPREQIAQVHLSSKERYVLSRVDGVRTLAQIAAVSPISRAELARIVDGFVARGVLAY
jgi:hypothetical protein